MAFAHDFYNRALAFFHQERSDEAITVAAVGLEQFPENGPLWQILGLAHWQQRQYEEAQAALETATCLVPLMPLAELALASLYVREGKKELAKVMYVNLARPGRCPVELLPKVASGLGHIQEYFLALQVCEKLTGENPSHHGAWFGIAFYRSRLDYPPSELIVPLSMAMDLAPHILTYRLNLACVWVDLGRYGNAYDLLKTVSIEQINHPCWLRKMTAVFEHFEDLDRCLACIQQMENLKPMLG